MGNLHVLETDLPVLSKPDRFRKASAVARKLWQDAIDAGAGGIKTQRAWLDRWAALQPMLPAFRAELDAIQRPATRSEIASALVTLRDMLPPGNRTPTAASNKMMAERVGSTEPSIGAVNFAVLHMIDTFEWYPVTAKVLATLAEITASLGWVAHALDRLPEYQLEITAKLAEAEREEAEHFQRRAAQAAYQRSLQARPVSNGNEG